MGLGLGPGSEPGCAPHCASGSPQAAILQQTAEYIFSLEQEKTRLLQQNTQLKRFIQVVLRALGGGDGAVWLGKGWPQLGGWLRASPLLLGVWVRPPS